VKQVWRLFDECGAAFADYLSLEDEAPPAQGQNLILHHPSGDWRETTRKPAKVEALLAKVMEEGAIVATLPSLQETREGLGARLSAFDATYLRLLNPHVYKVSISAKLKKLKLGFIQEHFKEAR
jgi:nicotinate phosphoribosyltransferase